MAGSEAAEKRKETKAKQDAVKAALAGFDEKQRAYALSQLLEESEKLRADALETLLEGWAGTLEGKNPDRLEWVRDYFGTKFEREGKPRFRAARLTDVVAKLVEFCLSAADKPDAEASELGLFELTAEPKTGEALLALAGAGEGVVLTKHQYNQFMKVMRLLEEQGETLELPDGKSVKGYVKELLPDGFVGVKTFTEKEQYKKRRAAYEKGRVSKKS